MTDPADYTEAHEGEAIVPDPASVQPEPAVLTGDAGSTRSGSRRSSWRLIAVLFGVAGVVVVIDQVVKTWAVATLIPGEPRTLISGWLELLIVRNPGAAFSFFTGGTWLFTVVAVVVAVVIVRMSRRVRSLTWAFALGLLLGGAMGNLVDRVIREPGFGRGHVVDFIHYLRFPFIDFPVFNLADSCIVTAAILIGWLGFRGIGIDGRRQGDRGGTGQQ